MALTLSDKDGSFSMPLYNAQDLSDSRDADVDEFPIIGFDSDTNFTSSLDFAGQVTITGNATAFRLSQESQYNSDPETALAEWYADALATVNGAQGEGYTLSRDYRNDSFSGLITEFQITQRGGEPFELAWNLSMRRGVAVDPYEAPNPVTVSPGGDYTVAGETLSGIREWSVSKTQSVGEYRRYFADTAEENDLLSEGGASKKLTVVGETVGDAATRNTFASDITTNLGDDEPLDDVRDALLGVTWSGQLTSFEDTDEAGRSRLGDIAVEWVEGTT